LVERQPVKNFVVNLESLAALGRFNVMLSFNNAVNSIMPAFTYVLTTYLPVYDAEGKNEEVESIVWAVSFSLFNITVFFEGLLMYAAAYVFPLVANQDFSDVLPSFLIYAFLSAPTTILSSILIQLYYLEKKTRLILYISLATLAISVPLGYS